MMGVSGLGHFGGGEDWAFQPIAFAPNPVECLWIGPRVSDFDCSTCGIGYETTSADNTTCVKPEFRPYRGWDTSANRTQLQIQDLRGTAIEIDKETKTSILSTEHTYRILAPLLQPKERKVCRSLLIFILFNTYSNILDISCRRCMYPDKSPCFTQYLALVLVWGDVHLDTEPSFIQNAN